LIVDFESVNYACLFISSNLEKVSLAISVPAASIFESNAAEKPLVITRAWAGKMV